MSVSNAAQADARTPKSPRRWWLLLASLCGAGLVAGGWAWWTDRRYKGAMEAIEAEIMAGNNAIACRDLDRLLSWKSDPTGGIVYLLGSCELARGRSQAAGEAWARVVPGSTFSQRAIRGRVRLFHESGQPAAAEELINDAARDPRYDPTAVRVLLVSIYSELGRIEEATRLIEGRWEHLNAAGEGALEPAIKLVRQHVEVTLKAAPAETIRAVLDQAARLAPDDDRVWLGRANLAIRTGAFDEAERWLDACQRRRPDDVPVWRGRLSWAIATNRREVVKQALTHMPAAEFNPAELYRLTAWLAARQGDAATERRELQLLIAIDPADVTALDRLAKLAEKDGQPAQNKVPQFREGEAPTEPMVHSASQEPRPPKSAEHRFAAELVRKKSGIERMRTRYLKLHDRQQPLRDAVELARLAEQLGRRCEARGFLTVAIAHHPDRQDLKRDLARLSQPPQAIGPRGLTLADLVAYRLRDVGMTKTVPVP
jgi:tetratricopeptide (TPR) repeat protein